MIDSIPLYLELTLMNLEKFNSLALIDWDLAYERVAGKKALAEELFQLLQKRLPTDLETLQTAFDNKDWNNLRNTTHAINGAASYCGLPRLLALARALETAIKTQAFSEAEQVYLLFIETIQATIFLSPRG